MFPKQILYFFWSVASNKISNVIYTYEIYSEKIPFHIILFDQDLHHFNHSEIF